MGGEAPGGGAGPSRRALPAAALAALAAAAFLPAVLHGGWIWDDPQHVTGNPLLRAPGGLLDVWADVAREPRELPQYYPMVHTTFWIEHALWGFRPAGFHLVNLLLHALNACLLWKVLRRLGLPGAWIAAALFAVHPVHAESVAWVTERKNVLSMAFALGSLLLLLRRLDLAEDGRGGEGDRPPRWGALLLFLAALLSKSVTAVLPAAVLVIAWWKRGCITKRYIAELLPLFAAGAASGLLTAWLERGHVGAEGADWSLSWGDRAVLAGRLPWFYAGKLLLPADLCFVYPRWAVDAGSFAQWLWPAGAAALLAAAWGLQGRIGRGPAAALLLFGGVLFPALGFLNVYPFRYSWAADHFQYHASAALLALLGAGAAAAAAALAARLPRAGPAVPALLLAPLVLLSRDLCGQYRDEEALWRRTLERNPGAWMARNNLGVLALQRGDGEGAERLFREAVAAHPRNHEAWNNLGTALLRRGDVEGAAAAYREAIRVMPEFSLAWSNLARALEAGGERDRSLECLRRAVSFPRTWEGAHGALVAALRERGLAPGAEAACREGLRRHPRSTALRVALADLLLERGAGEEAGAILEEALRADRDSVEARVALGTALFRRGGIGPALEMLRDAVGRDPSSPRARNDLAVVLRASGDAAGAEREWREAARLDPSNAEARASLGRLLLETGRAAEAEAELRAALAASPGSWRLHFGLGKALGAGGRLGEAAASFRETLRLRPGWAPAAGDLAWILATAEDPAVRSPAEAVPLAEAAAAATDRRDPLALETLGAAYAAAGRTADGIAALEEALRLGPPADVAAEIRARLEALR